MTARSPPMCRTVDERITARIEVIDKKDSDERKKLNHVLHKRFDQIVDEKTEEINETVCL